MKIHNGAIFHATWSYFQRLDDIQYKFLAEIGITEEDVFVEYNFAPPTLRRDIDILGLLHKRVFRKTHPVIQQFRPFHVDVFGSLRSREYNRQLYGHILDVQRQHSLHDRSIFGMVENYNKLPQEIVDCSNAKVFQKEMILIARIRCNDGDASWKRSFDHR